MLEVNKGYPEHYGYALGHLAEAEDEIVQDYPMFAGLIRVERKRLEDDPDYRPDWKGLVLAVMALRGGLTPSQVTLVDELKSWFTEQKEP